MKLDQCILSQLKKKIDYLFELRKILDQVILLFCHIRKDHPELQAVIDENTFGLLK
ncbi:MAG: hypothetical protein M5U17_03645 [Ignavibacterium sp.]|nr:hypothetical protein [Ignavibacterium sp.]